MHLSTTLFLAAAASTANAITIPVQVGNGGLKFTPNDIKAAVGDIIEFTFYPKNHSIAQSSFAAPCHPLPNAFFSTFQPTTLTTGAPNKFTLLINDTKPIWFYCSQPTLSHCQSGMVGAINAPLTGNTLEAFTTLAKNASLSTSPEGGKLAGGLLVAAGSNSTASGASGVTTVVSTVTATVTASDRTYTTTYPVSVASTLTTPAIVSGSTTTTQSASGTATGQSSSSSAPAQSTNASLAGKNVVGVPIIVTGMLGVAVVFAVGML